MTTSGGLGTSTSIASLPRDGKASVAMSYAADVSSFAITVSSLGDASAINVPTGGIMLCNHISSSVSGSEIHASLTD